nr:flagellar basal body-associated FliL family protein [Oceaniglobus trochenteri]
MPSDTGKGKSGLKSLILSALLAALLGGGGFYAVWSGLILGAPHPNDPKETATLPGLPDITFIPLQPIVVSLGPGSRSRHLRFQGQLEVDNKHADDVTRLLPRVVDVLNSFLRAVEPAELEEPGSLIRLRSQMLRRAQIVVGDGRVRDLLIMEFVLN